MEFGMIKKGRIVFFDIIQFYLSNCWGLRKKHVKPQLNHKMLRLTNKIQQNMLFLCYIYVGYK
jgi:hypothetical protein